MPLDREFLRRHYASMSDEELFSLDREELVEAAQQIYDEEVQNRQALAPEPSLEPSGPTGEDVEAAPDWIDQAGEAFSSYAAPGNTHAPESVEARDVLEAAGIPALVDLHEEPEEDGQVRYRWRVLVPDKLLHRAMSVLDRDLFNQQFEADWRNHLELLTDRELRVMQPRYAFCGLYDKLERINRAYDEELRRRQLNP